MEMKVWCGGCSTQPWVRVIALYWGMKCAQCHGGRNWWAWDILVCADAGGVGTGSGSGHNMHAKLVLVAQCGRIKKFGLNFLEFGGLRVLLLDEVRV